MFDAIGKQRAVWQHRKWIVEGQLIESGREVLFRGDVANAHGPVVLTKIEPAARCHDDRHDGAVTPPNLSTDRVPGRLEFRTDHALHTWVANELVRRFNHRCCASIAELEASDRGLTREGLVREGTRHVKDDLRSVDDPSTRVLGWSTDRKIAALRNQIAEAEKRAEAEEHYQMALAVREKLVADFPRVPEYRRELAYRYKAQRVLLAEIGKQTSGEHQYRKALAVQEKLVADFPVVPEYRKELAGGYYEFGILLAHLKKRADAEEQYHKALAVLYQFSIRGSTSSTQLRRR